MLYVLQQNQYNFKHVNYGDKDINYVNESSHFTKLYYHTSYVSVYGIFIRLPIQNMIIIPSYKYSKINLNVTMNSDIIHFIEKVEYDILNPLKKNKKMLISNELKTGMIKVNEKNRKNRGNVVLKIIGIWETNITCGLKYKYFFY